MPTPDATVAKLKPNPRNPRKVTDAKLAMLKKAMERFGDLGGVVLNTTSGHLVGGHQRTKVLPRDAKVHVERRYASPTKAGTVAEGHIDWEGERFAYREVAWPADVEKAANLAANKGAGEFDTSAVAEWLGELDTGAFDMDLTMFDADEMAAIMAPDGAPSQREDDQLAPEPPTEPKSQTGDLWLLGKHRLMCGDSSSAQQIEALTAGSKVQMVYTDPPYGISLDVDYQAKQGKGPNWQGPKHRKVAGDDKPFSAEFLLSHFKDAQEVFLWGAENYAKTVGDGGSWICWDKKLESHDAYSSGGFELCWSKKRHHYQLARIVWTGFLATERGEKRVHPTQKPVALAAWVFARWGKPGDVVIDLYGGSGSTLLACEQADRVCLMMEMDPGYVDVIVSRWEKLTGNTAEKLGNGTVKVASNA